MIHFIRTNEDISGDKCSKTEQLSSASSLTKKIQTTCIFLHLIHKTRSKDCYLAEMYDVYPKHTQPELVKLKYKHKPTVLKLVISSMT